MKSSIVLFAAIGLSIAGACDVRVTLESGPICGLVDELPGLPKYARFLNVPYAEQPLGALRFKELQPVKPWTDDYDATVQGPICHQKDVFYGPMMQPRAMSEACIHANIFTPLDALTSGAKLPILVNIHGGAFQAGSADTDINGPEFFYDDNVVVISFNYRQNVFGFLSLNSSSIPGNAGLRDIITLLKWVRANAARFGGDPDNVTLTGQSSGSACAHLITLSPAAKGLAHKAILSSGSALHDFYTTAPAYSQSTAQSLLANLGITETDPEKIHDILIELPIDTIMEASYITQDAMGLVSFVPCIESIFDGITTVIPADPRSMIDAGYGKDFPLVLGYGNAECYALQPRIGQLHLVEAMASTSLAMIPARFNFYDLAAEKVAELGDKIKAKYFPTGEVTAPAALEWCRDIFFFHPVMKLATLRAEQDAAETYIYQGSYEGDYKVLQVALGLNYSGVGHFEDMSYVFRVNSMPKPDYETPNDDQMTKFMTGFIRNFMECSKPTCSGDAWWSPVKRGSLRYHDLKNPGPGDVVGLTAEQQDVYDFFTNIDKEYA